MTGFDSKRQMAADKFIAAEERKVGERYGYVPKLHPNEWMDEPAQEPVAMYGHCPMCGAKGVNRERRFNGNDLCASGHIYPSRDSITPPKRE